MAGNDESPWHGLDRRVSIVETRLNHVDDELKKMRIAVDTIGMKVDANTLANRDSADAITKAILEHEHREDDKARQRYEAQRSDSAATKRWIITTLISVVFTTVGWVMHGMGWL
jgi:hypothetical protein